MKGKKELFLVPYSHLDTQWRWEYPTTINKYLKKTLRESIYLFEKYPGHRFNFTGALRYAMMKEYFPGEFQKVKSFVGEGRWHIAGTSLDETDALIPSAESMIRNMLYGDRWFKKEFARTSRDYMIPDCFGFPANMPTLMAHCGIHGFSSNKLTWESAVDIPFEIGVWKGPDGSGIVSALNPCRYDSWLFLPIYLNPGRLNRLGKLGEKSGIWKSFQYYGVGDIGGAPTEGSVKRALSSIGFYAKKTGELTVRQGSADEFFEGISVGEKKRMDRYEGDFLLPKHSAGTLTSAAVMKRWNRKNEQLAFAAEAAAVTALGTAGTPYPSVKIEAAWQRVIGNQMHDILPGTSTPTAYEFSQNDEVIALNTWSTILRDSAAAIAPFVKGDGEILLFNPCGESRNDPVFIELSLGDDAEGKDLVLRDADGKTIPVQSSVLESGKTKITFSPELASFGWSRYALTFEARDRVEHSPNGVTIGKTEGGYVLENSHYRVGITYEGSVDSIFRKDLSKEILKKPLAYELQKERPMKFPAWNMDWRDRKKAPFRRIESGAEVVVVEDGPLSSTVRVTTKFRSSRFVKEINLAAGSEIVEITERIAWMESGCSLKVALTANMDGPEFTTNWETARMRRDVNRKLEYEMPSRLWADLSEGDWGVSILEDSKYGYDHPHKDTLRLTLLYTPGLRYLNGFWDQKSQDWGEHTVRYGIHAHRGDWKGTDVLARRFNQPVRSFAVDRVASVDRNGNFSLFGLSSEQLGVLGVKKAEDSDAVIVRLYERHGTAVKGSLTFASDLDEVMEVNGLEEIVGSVPSSGRKFDVSLEANGIRSFLVKPTASKRGTPVRQEPLSLEYNRRMIGNNGEKGKALFPAEITPQRIQAGPVSFDLAPDDKKNGLACCGQQVVVPAGYAALSILLGADETCEAPFRWIDGDGRTVWEDHRGVPALTGFVGQWDTRIWKREPKHHVKNRRDYAWINKCVGIRPGFVNRDRLEWYSTHTHEDGDHRAYRYGYLYTVTMDIPVGAETLKLPDDDRIRVMAITASEGFTTASSIQSLNDRFDF